MKVKEMLELLKDEDPDTDLAVITVENGYGYFKDCYMGLEFSHKVTMHPDERYSTLCEDLDVPMLIFEAEYPI